ncbi:response regulator [Lyngbya confervoides]|uniref:Response regulator n=1 Tax=Lyngbya confervoides BDU141951 TaxID=1574623 RepID=A0ABD4T804_9CYAN|nr:response regulator [Lyngbya confervoides]MCM1984917.1 response regulator [Lyngbya confervoides BDU141951]
MDIQASRPVDILLVEDSPSDAKLTAKTFERAKVLNHLHIVEDGVEAMQFLRRLGPYAQAPRPDLILLDLNLPKKDGRKVLAEIKQDADFASIPVVILTTSAAEEDILKSYALRANCYITKPVTLRQFTSVVQSIEEFWLTIVQLPTPI